MENKVNFNQLKNGETVEGVAALVKITKEGVSKNNKPYITLQFYGDGNSDGVTNLFITKEDFKIEPPCIIKARFSKDDRGYIDISNDYMVVEDMSMDDFIKTAPIPADECYDYIIKLINYLNYESTNITLYDLVLKIFEDNKDRLCVLPAAEQMHHAYKGGLIYHMRKMVKIAYDLSQDYPVDREVVVCASLLCVINKIYTLSLNDELFNAETNIYYYIFNNGELSDEICEKIMNQMKAESGKPYDMNRFLNFRICLKSYRGTCREGASIAPATLESFIVSMIHRLDAHVDVYMELKNKTKYYEISEYDKRINSRVFNI